MNRNKKYFLLTSFAFLLVILVKLFIFINAYKVVSNSKKEKISLRDLVYTISILLIFMMSLSVKSQDLTVFEGNWEASIQEKTQREFIDTLEFVDELISLEDNDLYEAAYLDADKSGNLIVYDYSKERIIFFPTGDYKSFNEITDGIGRGPKELKLARDLKFDSEGFIWVIDLDGGKIQKWDSENNLIKNFKPSLKYVRPYRIAVCENSIYMLSEQYIPDGIYHYFDLNGNHLRAFKKINTSNKEEFRLWTDASYFRGDLTCFKNNLIHVGRYKNYIRKYDEQGNLTFSKKVIEFEGNEEPLLIIRKRSSSRKSDVKTISGQIETVDDKMLISFSGKKNRHYYYLDIYDSNADYLMSFEFKHPTKEFTTDGTYIYALETHREDMKQYLSKYRLPKLE